VSEHSIKTTHVGSLPRSEELTALMTASEKGEAVDRAQLDDAIKRSVTDVVEHQKSIGLDIISDGEHGKAGFTVYLRDRLKGLGGSTEVWTFRDMAEVPELTAFVSEGEGNELEELLSRIPACVGPISYRGQEGVARDIANFKAALDGDTTDAFMPAASPGVIVQQMKNLHYGSYEDYLAAVADAMREEYTAIVDAGFTVQMDCPDIPIIGHSQFWASDVAERLGYEAMVELHIEAINRATAGLPQEQLRMHLCWGNYAGPHNYDVELRDIIDIVLKARVKFLSFEASNPRHEHEWVVFEDVTLPDDKVLIPGCIDSVSMFVEHPELVAQRIERFARLVGPERVVAGVDCGFGTVIGFTNVYPSIAWRKLESLVQGAALASEKFARVGS
jgi:5-methyltetrahydropteroyltriglutamate--homocysteine methyltransferase